ncbi:LCP family protein [Mycobacterium sp.]|uniref:LCP family glycopolymer transferase n=1 Tax=Mycobacterium sp. TaxID=1785 RepID=UPI002D63FF1A|nr:LCP family protein [Mycobacterium sp.]HZA10389.1 LCP family protein [Mycobacterium sp.]
MSDGDNATPGQPAPNGDRHNPWLTRSPRPSMGAAPWERRSVSRSEPAGAFQASDRPRDEQWSPTPPGRSTDRPPGDGEGRGNHAGTRVLTVADLIAKVGVNPRPTSHHANPEPEQVDDPADQQLWSEVTAPTPRVYESDVPNLSVRAGGRRFDAATTTELPAVADRPPPHRLGGASTTTEPEPKHRGRSVMIAGRAAASLTAVLALALTGAAWQWSSSKNHRMNHVSALDPNSRDIVDPTAQYGDENFLIVGVDSRAGANSAVGAGNTQDAGGIRSDTVMLVNIPASRKRVVAVSFPRDLAITPMLCDAWNSDTGQYGPLWDDQTRSYGPEKVYTETKLNSAYAFGGPKCLVKVIQKLSGLSINRFMAVDFVGFEKMVDAVGGVQVCSTTALKDYELGTVLANPGRQIVDGKTALNYVRARQVTTEVNGDYGRIKRQQLFLSSLLRSLISKEVFFNPSKLNNVVDMFINASYVDNIQTKDLVNLGQSLQNIAAGRISFLTVPTTGYADEQGNEQLREDDNRAMFNAIINDDPLPGENNNNETTTPTTAAAKAQAQTSTAPSTPQTPAQADGTELVDATTTEPKAVTVHVSNSTGQTGLAATTANALQRHGFNVLNPDDYPRSLQSTTVFFSPGNEKAAATVASSFSNAPIERVTGMGDVVQVVLGPDFHTVSAPQPTGSSVKVHVTRGTNATPTRLPEDLSITNAADTTCK